MVFLIAHFFLIIVSSSQSLSVSIIIPVFNDLERLKLCLHALENQTYPQEQYEIIVVDNNSTESLESIKKDFPHVNLVQELTPGSYIARNNGITLAKGDILAFTDSDCIPHKDWLEQGVHALLSTSNCGLVAGKIDLFFQDSNHPTLIELYEKVTAFPQEKYVKERQFGVTANLFTYKTVMDTVGQFNDTLKSGGDREWGRRVVHHGYQVIYVDTVCVNHPARVTWKQLHSKIIRQTSGLLDINNLSESQTGLDNLINWIAYLLPSPRIIKLIIKEKEIKGYPKKIQLILIMFLVKVTRFYESLLLFLKLKTKAYK